MKKLFVFLLVILALLDLSRPGYGQPAQVAMLTDTDLKIKSVTSLSAVVATGAGTDIDVGGYSVVGFEVTISNTATVAFQGVVDTTYGSLACAPFGGGAVVTQTTATGLFRCVTAGLRAVRPNVTAYTSGTVTVIAYATTAQVGQNDTVATSGTGAVNVAQWLGSTAPTVGQKTAANSVPVVPASDVNAPVNMAQVGGTNTVTGGVAGSQGIGGLAATNAAVAGNPLYNGCQAMTDGTPPSSVTGGNLAPFLCDRYGRVLVSQDHPKRFNCSVVNNSATALTAFGSPCAAPGAGLSLYITDVTASASVIATTTADQYLEIKSGTGGTCGTATAVVWAAYNLAFAPIAANFIVPIKVAANSELCWMHAATGSKTFVVQGYIAP